VNHPLIPHPTMLTIATMMITMVAGTAVIMWMGELVTDRGIGNEGFLRRPARPAENVIGTSEAPAALKVS